MNKYSWYFLLVVWLVLSFILYVTFLFSELIGEIGIYVLGIGLLVVMPRFLFLAIILAFVKTLLSKILTKKNLWRNTIIILATSSVGTFFFLKGLHILGNFYAGDSDRMYIIYPWFFIIPIWLFLFNLLANLIHITIPSFWISKFTPSVIILSIFCAASPFFMLGEVYLIDKGCLCFLANKDNKKECFVNKFINRLETSDGCLSGDIEKIGLAREDCLRWFAIENKDMSVCALLDNKQEKESSLWWNYSDRKFCLYSVVYRSSDINNCSLITDGDVIECKDTFKIWAKNEIEKEKEYQEKNIFEKFLEKINEVY